MAELLKEMGFAYRKQKNHKYYYEQPRIIEQRHAYLRKMMQNRVEKKPGVFLDETWANSHDGRDEAWVENDPVTGGTIRGVRHPLHLVKGHGALFLEQGERWVGFPIPLLSSVPRSTQATTMTR